MKVIGITGSSGAGKTTVSEMIEKKYDAQIINADEVVKEMSVPGTEYMKQIEFKLGKSFFKSDGSLNKKKLADEIYEKEQSLEILNNLTFKYVVEEIRKRIFEVKNSPKFLIIDAPLLIESNLNSLCDYIVSVIADEETKIDRICKRDGLDVNLAKKRLNIQKTDDFYIKNSNFTINNSLQNNLENEIKLVMEKIKNAK